MEAIEAVDSALLQYFIKQPDVKFLRLNKPDGTEEAYVQAKLTAFGDDDDHSNGTGVCDTYLVLFNVNDQVK